MHVEDDDVDDDFVTVSLETISGATHRFQEYDVCCNCWTGRIVTFFGKPPTYDKSYDYGGKNSASPTKVEPTPLSEEEKKIISELSDD